MFLLDLRDTSSQNYHYHSSLTINPFDQNTISINTSLDGTKNLNEKEIKRKLPSVSLDSSIKTIPLTQYTAKNSMHDLLPIENNQLTQVIIFLFLI